MRVCFVSLVSLVLLQPSECMPWYFCGRLTPLAHVVVLFRGSVYSGPGARWSRGGER